MRRLLTEPIQWLLRHTGYQIQPLPDRKRKEYPPDFEPDETEILQRVRPYTMTGDECVVSLIRAVRYVVENGLPGDIVECGVWRGGSMAAVALTLLKHGDRSRRLWLYDTYEGMPPPGNTDVSFDNRPAAVVLERQAEWLTAPLDGVREVMRSTGYDLDKIEFVKGRVEDSIPGAMPAQISLLRLDTDWYESTRHEFVHLYPQLVRGGVIIIDDYGCWRGSRKATDEYIQIYRVPLLLNRIDFTARFGVKI